MISLDDFNTEEDYQNYLEGLYLRVKNGESLSPNEQHFMCKCMAYENQKKYEFCDDIRFQRLFLKKMDSLQNTYELDEFEKKDLQDFLNLWGSEMKKENHRESLMHLIAAETRQELKKIFPNFKLLNKIFRHAKYREDKHIILGYSKYAYIKIKSVFLKLGHNKITASLNKNPIEIDEYSLIHIYFRHYAKLIKPYDTDDKSFFTPEIRMEEIPNSLAYIINAIDKSKLYVNNDHNNINFRFKYRDYKVFCKKVTKQIKGIGNVEAIRVNTFYPIEFEEDKLKLKGYTLKRINRELSVYIKK